MNPPTQWNESNKKTFCVVASSALSMPASLGVVYCADKFLPRQMDWLKETLATHLVEPHIAFFEKITQNLKKAHEQYDERKAELLKQEGKPLPKPSTQEDVHQRAKDISSKLITFATALTADVAASYGIQKKLNDVLKVSTNPCRTCFAEGGVQLLLTAAMPTLFARTSENIHFGVAKTLRKATGADPKVADDIAISSTYVVFPGLVAAAAALLSAHHTERIRS